MCFNNYRSSTIYLHRKQIGVTLNKITILTNPPANPHCARVVGYGLFSLCVIHMEDLCPSSGDINKLMMLIDKSAAYKRQSKSLRRSY
jgi:hypothetical protein